VTALLFCCSFVLFMEAVASRLTGIVGIGSTRLGLVLGSRRQDLVWVWLYVENFGPNLGEFR
jgi:hypothetical protein